MQELVVLSWRGETLRSKHCRSACGLCMLAQTHLAKGKPHHRSSYGSVQGEIWDARMSVAMEYCFAVAPSDVLTELRNLSEETDIAWRASTVYDGVAERESHKRRSVQKTLKDERIFALADAALLPLLSKQMSFAGLRLVRNHVDCIKSVPGDEFEAHRDFELLAGAGTRSLALLVCLQPPFEGGELVLGPGTDEETKITYSAGTIVLFACRTTHAALPVTSGEKLLLKFDVLASEDLCVLRVATAAPADRRRIRVTLGQSVLRQCDALMAKLDFIDLSSSGADRGDALAQLETNTDLVNAEEIRLLLDFYLHRSLLPEVTLPIFRALLDRLCCPEASLSDGQLMALQENGCTLLREIDDIQLFAGRNVFRLVFAASANRTSSFSPRSSARSEDETLPFETESSWSIGEGGGQVVVFSSSRWRPPEVHEADDDEARTAFALVLDHEVKRLEGQAYASDQDYLTEQEEEADDNVETRRPISRAAFQAGKAPPLSLREDYEFLTPQRLQLCSATARAALRAAEPAQQISSQFREEEECNDGGTYTTVRYETTIFRRGYLLVDPTRLEICSSETISS